MSKFFSNDKPTLINKPKFSFFIYNLFISLLSSVIPLVIKYFVVFLAHISAPRFTNSAPTLNAASKIGNKNPLDCKILDT